MLNLDCQCTFVFHFSGYSDEDKFLKIIPSFIKGINLFKYLLSVSHLGSKSTTNLLAPGQVNT